MAEKMVNCKACGKEIAKSAKVCPHCGAKQKGKVGLIVIIVIVILVLIGILGSGSKDEENRIDNSSSQSVESVTTSKESESTVSEEEYVKVGGSFEDKGLKFSVDSADLNYIIEDDEFGFYKLDDGLHYVKVDFTFENTGDSGDKYVSIYDFDCYADNTACEQKYVTSVTGDFMNRNLSPGRNVSFSTLYAVPDEANEIELEYTSNIWTDEKVKVKLK